jgi:hypothetical protein
VVYSITPSKYIYIWNNSLNPIYHYNEMSSK